MDIQIWKEKIKDVLKERFNAIEQDDFSKQLLGYSFLVQTVIWPLIEEIHATKSFSHSLFGLNKITSEIGPSIIATQLENWQQNNQRPSWGELAEWVIQKVKTDSDFLLESDNIIAKLEILELLKTYGVSDKGSVFINSVLRDSKALKNNQRLNIRADGNMIVVGDNNTVIGPYGLNLSNISGNVEIHIANEHSTDKQNEEEQKLQEAIEDYLGRLKQECNRLTDLAALSLNTEGTEQVTLDKVYIGLNALEEGDHTYHSAFNLDRNRRGRNEPMIDVVSQSERLVILGQPGSGKSVFVKRVATEAVEKYLENQNAHEEELPIPIITQVRGLKNMLSELDVSGKSLEDQYGILRQSLIDHWIERFKAKKAFKIAEMFETILDSRNIMLIFDGLDEIAQSFRPLIYKLIQSFRSFSNIKKIIVTSRIRSYLVETKNNQVLPGFRVQTLAPFSSKQIEEFISLWYEAVETDDDKKERIKDLQAAAKEEKIGELAQNPMLLTTMALIHQSRAELPKQRVRLYQEAVDILLVRWQKARGLEISEKLKQVLDNKKHIRRIMERLGYEAHKLLEHQSENADLTRGHTISILEEVRYLGVINEGLVGEFLDYVDLRAGILVGQGGNEHSNAPQLYRFPHRTFLEYLAGCYLVQGRSREIHENYKDLVKAGNDWYVAAQMGVEELLHNRDREGEVLDLAYYLSSDGLHDELNEVGKQRASVWAGYIAVQTGKQAMLDDSGYGGENTLNSLRGQMTHIIDTSVLPIHERVEAGRFLGVLGDERPGVGVYINKKGIQVPDIAWGVEVPIGEYTIGGDKDAYDSFPKKKVSIKKPYQLSRHLVTNSQFQCFVDSGEYHDARWWQNMPVTVMNIQGEAISIQELDFQELRNPNHPREMVSWYQVIAFCRWLSAKIGEPIWIPDELEWEIAARYPGQKVFPWGTVFNSSKANTSEGKVGRPTTVGLFLNGRNKKLNLFDVAGNVLEWCANKFDFEQQCIVDASDDYRAVRGGSWYANSDFARSCSRLANPPGHRFDSVGFRLIRKK